MSSGLSLSSRLEEVQSLGRLSIVWRRLKGTLHHCGPYCKNCCGCDWAAICCLQSLLIKVSLAESSWTYTLASDIISTTKLGEMRSTRSARSFGCSICICNSDKQKTNYPRSWNCRRSRCTSFHSTTSRSHECVALSFCSTVRSK